MEEKHFITTKEDLIKILAKNPNCFNSTVNGKLILSYEQLPNIYLKKFKKKTVYNLIVNSAAAEEYIKIGHWFNLIVFKNNTVFFLDGLNQVKSQPFITTNIKKFAKNNNLAIYDFNVRYQNQSSKKCGYLACFFVYKSLSNSIPSFLKLKKMLKQNSIKTNEQYIFKSVKRYFKLNF